MSEVLVETIELLKTGRGDLFEKLYKFFVVDQLQKTTDCRAKLIKICSLLFQGNLLSEDFFLFKKNASPESYISQQTSEYLAIEITRTLKRINDERILRETLKEEQLLRKYQINNLRTSNYIDGNFRLNELILKYSELIHKKQYLFLDREVLGPVEKPFKKCPKFSEEFKFPGCYIYTNVTKNGKHYVGEGNPVLPRAYSCSNKEGKINIWNDYIKGDRFIINLLHFDYADFCSTKAMEYFLIFLCKAKEDGYNIKKGYGSGIKRRNPDVLAAILAQTNSNLTG